MVTVTICGQHCGSKDLVRNGHASYGKQRYRCKSCKKQSRENPAKNGYTDERGEEIIKSYQERSSLRGLTRTFGVSRNTVKDWLKKAAALPPLRETLIAPDPDDPDATIMELDELWSFIFKKDEYIVDMDCLVRKTRQVIARAVGDRNKDTCLTLWNKIPEAYQSGQYFSDFWSAYQAIIPEEQLTQVGKETGETAHVERWNCTLRVSILPGGRVRGMVLPSSPPLRTVLVDFSTYGSSLSFRPCDRARLSYEDMLAVNLLVTVWMEQHAIFCPI